ncbi:MAG: hypothetical protein FJ291_11920 [Planctomycetes bacterium]|nr:hypothetical protein [Planctomycetota bacterium]
MGKKLLFLADVHLCPERPERGEALAAFLRAQRGEAEAIYIVGDLMDYWVGPRQLRRPAWARIFRQLAEAAAGGPPVRVLGGNRDFLLDSAALAPHGLQWLGMDHAFQRDALRFRLVHGHMHFPDPWLSRLLLRFIQGRVMRWAARVAPIWACLRVAAMLRWWRRLVVGKREPRHAKRYDPAAFAPLFDAGADVVICGHNHWACDYTPLLARALGSARARPGCRLFALGPWNPGPSYLEYADGAFRLVDPSL